MPSISDIAGDKRRVLEDFGFSRTHRRDGGIDSTPSLPDNTFSTTITKQLTQTKQELPDWSIDDDIIESIKVDKLRAGNVLVNEYLQSVGFTSGSIGWRILGNGDVEFNSGTFRGTLTAGELHIPDQDTTADSFHVNSGGDVWWGATETNFNANNDNALAYILKDGTAKFQTALTIKQAILTYRTINSLFFANTGSVPKASPNSSMPMTNNGRYCFAYNTNEWKIFDSFIQYSMAYRSEPEYSRTGLTITPTVATRVMSGSTEYVIAADDAGTTFYRYDDDGQNETACTVSGDTLVGARRVGYNETQGYVYLQDDATGLDGTSIKRYTFSGTTLTYADTVTLDTAPANDGSRLIWIGDNNMAFTDTSVSSNPTWQRYTRDGGVQQTARKFGSINVNNIVLGHSVRQADNAMFQWMNFQASTGNNANSIAHNIAGRLD